MLSSLLPATAFSNEHLYDGAKLQQGASGSEVQGRGMAGAAAPQLPPVATGRPAGKGRSSSRFRGVSHDKGSRFESHIWHQKKQLYIGAFFNEELAARAFDLASVACRGAAGPTNFPLDEYEQELAAAAHCQLPLEAVVAHLRDQAKQLSRPDAAAGGPSSPLSPALPCLEAWELPLSEVVTGQRSLGLFTTETDAAQAYDRALLARDGLAAAPTLNFPLANYAWMLDAAQVAEAVRLGLLPAPAAQPVPSQAGPAHHHAGTWPGVPQVPGTESPVMHHADSLQAAYELTTPFACVKPNSEDCGNRHGEACAIAPELPAPLPRRASVTPRHAAEASPSPFAFLG